MKNNVRYDLFLEKLYSKYPKKSRLTQALMDLLHLEREAIYRRLRKEMFFSSQEIMKIASSWNISLDDIIGVDALKIAFLMQPVNFCGPSQAENYFLRNIITLYETTHQFPNAEFMSICNKIPKAIYANFANLNHYFLFKWLYLFGNENDVVCFSKATIPEESKPLISDYTRAIKNVPNTSFIWDENIFYYLINNIKYFHSIQLITDNEKKLLKEDLHALLSYLQNVADKGCYPETGKKVNLYISQINIDTNYSYIFSPEVNVCFVHSFEQSVIYSSNTDFVENFKKWMQYKRRTSIQISEVDAKTRIEFFSKQLQRVDHL